jgi:hypothetical protein
MKYDIFGDIHGHFYDLLALLNKMDYQKSLKGSYYHQERQAIFVGDYIDRGQYSKEVVQLVRDMCENGKAIALMGNHEYNALCYHTKGISGEYLRPRTNQNIKQHSATLQSFGTDTILKESLEWFKQLPLYYENDYFRVVHACWDSEKIEILKKKMGGNLFKMEFLESSTVKGTDLFEAVETLLKGKEIDLPMGVSFLDKDSHERKRIRVKWWENPEGKNYLDYAVKVEKEYEMLKTPVAYNLDLNVNYCPKDKPVFFGHYWLDGVIPSIQKPNVCCVDYSVAQSGKLVAYRFDGEKKLDDGKFCW